MNDHQDLVRDFASHTTGDLHEIEVTSEVALAGLVTALRKRKNKKNEAWASFLLEDLEGACEVLVFPRVYKECQELLAAEAPILVRGRADVEEERVRFIADEVAPLEGLRERRAEAASLRLQTTGLEAETLERLEALLVQHRGSVPLYVDLTLPHRMSVLVRLDAIWHVRPTADLTSSLDALLGPRSIVYRAGPARPGPDERAGQSQWGRARAPR